ncbi:MAG: peptidylprolyl isomerase, partial [Planctomycetes bacterium]|nr:peptidylprolyl isomerase [Planctomycetota bacterium]
MTLYINDEKIDARIQADFERLKPDYEKAFVDQPAEEQQKQLLEWSRENVIEHVLMRQAAIKKCEPIDTAKIDAVFNEALENAGGRDKFFEQIGLAPDKEDEVKKSIEDQMRLENIVKSLTANAKEPTDKDVKKYYDRNMDRFLIPETIRASHIIKHTGGEVDPAKAKEQIDEIYAGIIEKDNFEEVASQHSDCPENAGDLGYFARGQMVQRFEDVAFKLEVGQMSEPFETEFGFHIAKVFDKKESMHCPLEDVTELIVKELTEENHQKEIEK